MKAIHILCIVTLLSACSGQVQRENVIGTYYANHGHGEETLELLPNGKYVLTYNNPGQPALRNENTWELESDADGAPALSFKAYVFGYRDRQALGPSTPGWWHVRVEKTWSGHIELVVDPDLGHSYIKANGAK